MKLARFFIGLSLILIALVAFRYGTDPFAKHNLVILFGEATGTIMGGLILGLVIWAPVRIFKGHESTPDIRTFTLYAAVISVTIITLAKFTENTTLSNNQRHEFATGSKKTCFSSQRKAKENSELTDMQLNEFCECFSSSISKAVTKSEMADLRATKIIPESLIIKQNEITQECSDQLVKK